MARIASVTGSDSGIGKATAVALAEAGFDVGITWHEDQQGAEDTAAQVREAGQKAEVRRLDCHRWRPGADGGHWRAWAPERRLAQDLIARLPGRHRREGFPRGR